MLDVLHLTHFPETIVDNSVSICLLSQELIQEFIGDDDYVRHDCQIGKAVQPHETSVKFVTTDLLRV